MSWTRVAPVDRRLHERTYSSRWGYEWDPRKARFNLTKHRVDFADAALVLEDPLALTRQDADAEGEERFVTLGIDPVGRLLVVVWTPRRGQFRLISARRATAAERRQYEER